MLHKLAMWKVGCGARLVVVQGLLGERGTKEGLYFVMVRNRIASATVWRISV